MDTQGQASSNANQRRSSNDENTPPKRQRLEVLDEAPLPVEVIDAIENMNPQNLFKIANSNSLSTAAGSTAAGVYQRKFGTKPVVICDYEDIRQNSYIRHPEKFTSTVVEYGGKIYILGLKAYLPYLRCFGRSISNLTIDYNGSKSKRVIYLHQFINDYCCKSLVKIAFFRMPSIAIKQFQQVFANARLLSVSQSDLGKQIPAFAKCFPNLRAFNAIDTKLMERFGAQRFKHLEHLKIHERICSREFTSIQFVADLLNGSRRLNSLDIALCMDTEEPISVLLDLIRSNRLITKLISSTKFAANVSLADVRRIINEHPTLIELNLSRNHFAADDAIALIRQLNSLKKITLTIDNLDCGRFESQLRDGWKVVCRDIDFSWQHLLKITLQRNASIRYIRY